MPDDRKMIKKEKYYDHHVYTKFMIPISEVKDLYDYIYQLFEMENEL